MTRILRFMSQITFFIVDILWSYMPRGEHLKGKKLGGRPKGVPNKVSTTVKENVIQVFQQLGGAKAMVEWAKENPTHFYNLYAKLLPQDINKTVEHKIPTSIVFNAVDMSKQVEYVDSNDVIDVEMKQEVKNG